MDVIFGFVGDKFAVVVSDTMAVQQIIINKDDEDKTLELDSHKLMAMSGPKGDCVYFGEYIQANMKRYELRNGMKLSTHAAARTPGTNSPFGLRKGPCRWNLLLAGTKAADEAVSFMDYLASCQKVNSGGHGMAACICLSVLCSTSTETPDDTATRGRLGGPSSAVASRTLLVHGALPSTTSRSSTRTGRTRRCTTAWRRRRRRRGTRVSDGLPQPLSHAALL